MTTDNGGSSDEVMVDTAPSGGEPDYGPQADPIPPRPAANANRSEWEAYVIALGLHPDAAETYELDELPELADHLGG